MTEERMITTTLRLPPKLIERIDYVVEGTGKSRSDFIREAIYEKLIEEERKKKIELAIRKIMDFLGKEENPTEAEIKELIKEIQVLNGGAQ